MPYLGLFNFLHIHIMGILDGKAIIITGAGRGIGRSCARMAAQEGASVVVNDIEPALVKALVEELTENDVQVIGHVGDVSEWRTAESLVGTCVSRFGKLGLVNNAGLFHITRATNETEVDIRRTIDVNGVLARSFVEFTSFERWLPRGLDLS